MSVDDLLVQAVDALSEGHHADAQRILVQVLNRDSNNERAWLLLSRTVGAEEYRKRCLEKVLELDPNSQEAKDALTAMNSDGPTVERESTPPEPNTTGELPPEDVNWVRLREDPDTGFPRKGCLSLPLSLHISYRFKSGHLEAERELSSTEYGELWRNQKKKPTVTMKRDEHTCWAYKDRFYWEDKGYTSDEVSALLEGPLDDALRPHSFAEFVGQSRVKTSLGEAMDAVRQADERMGHILLCGPAGLGKKALVRAIAYELGVGILGSISKVPAAALLELQDGHKPLAAHLVSLRHGQVLRIADIGNVQFTQSALEVLFRAMLNEPNRQSVRAESHRWFAEYDFSRSPFTLIATTKSMSEVPERLLPLFHHVYHLSRYSIPELTVLIRRAAEVLKVDVTGPAAELIAECAAGHTSVAAHLMLRTAQHGASLRADEITAKLAEELLWRLGLVRPELVDDDAAAREPIPHWMRRAVLDRDQGICRYCGQRAMTLQLDHIVPVSQGGHSTVANLVTACAECNLKKASRTPEEAGMTVLPAGSRLQ